MTNSPQDPTVSAGWYADPEGSGQLRWWDGTAWTQQLSGAQSQGPSGARPQLSPQAAIYGPLIWVLVFLPLVSAVLALAWNPAIRTEYLDGSQTPTLDPTSLFTPVYFLLGASGWIIYAATVVLAYFDWRKLGRVGVVRPFHWAWSFLTAPVYIIGRSVIVRKAAPRRGLAPIWWWIAVSVIGSVIALTKAAVLVSQISQVLPANG